MTAAPDIQGLFGQLVAGQCPAQGHEQSTDDNLIHLTVRPDRIDDQQIMDGIPNNHEIPKPAGKYGRCRLAFDEPVHDRQPPIAVHYAGTPATPQPKCSYQQGAT